MIWASRIGAIVALVLLAVTAVAFLALSCFFAVVGVLVLLDLGVTDTGTYPGITNGVVGAVALVAAVALAGMAVGAAWLTRDAFRNRSVRRSA